MQILMFALAQSLSTYKLSIGHADSVPLKRKMHYYHHLAYSSLVCILQRLWGATTLRHLACLRWAETCTQNFTDEM